MLSSIDSQCSGAVFCHDQVLVYCLFDIGRESSYFVIYRVCVLSTLQVEELDRMVTEMAGFRRYGILITTLCVGGGGGGHLNSYLDILLW